MIQRITTQEEAQKLLRDLNSTSSIQFDIETNGLNPYLNELLLFQIGTDSDQYLINPELLSLFRELLENKELIIHNALFELQFLYVRNIFPSKVYDTMLADKVLYMGLDLKFSLQSVVKRHLKIEMDKTAQKSFVGFSGELTQYQLEYAAIDVMYLNKVKEVQDKKIAKKDLSKAVELENEFVKSLAYLSICGMKVDSQKWRDKVEEDTQKLKRVEAEILDLVSNTSEYSFMLNPQYNIFQTAELGINLDSNKDIIWVCKKLGMDVTNPDDPEKESVSETVLTQYKDNPFINLLLKYRELKKSVSTYGMDFLTQINPITGRIHSHYTQMVASGRTISKQPNLNNLPSDYRTRSCFIAEPGNVLINADYSDQEGRLFANYSKEKNLIDFYNGDFADGHSYVAKLCFKKELEGIPMEEVKAKRSDLRAMAKTARFAIYYGGNGHTIAKNLKIDVKVGEEIYEKYLKAFPDLAAYFDKVKNYTKVMRYILVSPITKRKVFTFDSTPSYDFIKKSLNYPIQGSAAEMSKIALIRLFKLIKTNGHLGKVKIIGFIYDEIIVESPEDLAEYYKEKLKECMERAALLFCKYVPIPVEPEIATYWKH